MWSGLVITQSVLHVTCWFFLNTLRPRQHGRHFADDMFKCIFLNGNIWIPIEISLKFVPKGSINNNPALFQIMAWRRPGDKPLSEPMMVSLPMHICVTQPQWVKILTKSQQLTPLHWHEKSTMTTQITGNLIVCQIVCLRHHQIKYQSPCYWPLVKRIHWSLVDSPHKRPITWKMFMCHHIACHIKNLICILHSPLSFYFYIICSTSCFNILCY